MRAIRKRSLELNDVDTEGSWAVSYGDMITLLLTFFLLFFSTNKDKERMQAMEDALVMRLEKAAAEPPIELSQSGQDPQFEEMMLKRLSAQVHRVGTKLIVEFPGVSFFGFAQVELTKAGMAQLKRFVDLYLPYAGNYILGIRAYTDNVKVKSRPHQRFKDNLELSALRSVATMRAFQKMGIPLNRMRLGGYGELRLTADELQRAIAKIPNYPKKGLALARKVVLVIEPDLQETL